MSELDEITLVTAPAAEMLNERQLADYRTQRTDCLRWLLNFGKDPDHVDGYAFETVRARASRMDRFYRGSGRRRIGTSPPPAPITQTTI